MSVYLYDEAVVNQLRKITGDDRIHVIDPSQSISFLAQFDKDKVELPAIVVSRGLVRLLDYRNQAVALKGQTARRNSDDNLYVKAQLIPMRVEWNIDIFTVDRYTCDEIVRELVFYFTTRPRFEITVPYDLDIVQNFDVLLSQDIVDNSDLVEFPNTGERFRETLTIYTENAHMYTSHKQYPTVTKSDVVDIRDSKINKGDEHVCQESL